MWIVGDIVDEEHQVSSERGMVTEIDREGISRGVAAGFPIKVIAAGIGRSVNVVSREKDWFRAIPQRYASGNVP